MKFFVKWLNYEDDHNSWISWDETKDLAALDTYLLNNPDITVPVSNIGLSCSKNVDETAINKFFNNSDIDDDEIVMHNFFNNSINNDEVKVENNDFSHGLEPRASLLLVNANTQPGNVCRFANPDDINLSHTKTKSTLKKKYRKKGTFVDEDEDISILLDDKDVSDGKYENMPTLVSDDSDDEDKIINDNNLKKTSSKKKKSKQKVHILNNDKFIPPIINYLGPKSIRGALKEDSFKEYQN